VPDPLLEERKKSGDLRTRSGNPRIPKMEWRLGFYICPAPRHRAWKVRKKSTFEKKGGAHEFRAMEGGWQTRTVLPSWIPLVRKPRKGGKKQNRQTFFSHAAATFNREGLPRAIRERVKDQERDRKGAKKANYSELPECYRKPNWPAIREERLAGERYQDEKGAEGKVKKRYLEKRALSPSSIGGRRHRNFPRRADGEDAPLSLRREGKRCLTGMPSGKTSARKKHYY